MKLRGATPRSLGYLRLGGLLFHGRLPLARHNELHVAELEGVAAPDEHSACGGGV